MGYCDIIFSILYSISIDYVISGGQIFEESILQFIECKQLDVNNPSTASPQEQLISTAKFNSKGMIKFI
jgi:hypothetical protein